MLLKAIKSYLFDRKEFCNFVFTLMQNLVDLDKFCSSGLFYNKGAPEESNSDDSAVSAEFKTESDKASNFQHSEEGEFSSHEKGKE